MKLSERRRSVKRLVRLTLGLDVLVFLVWSVAFILYTASRNEWAFVPLQVGLLAVGVFLVPGVILASITNRLPPLRMLVWPLAVAYSFASGLTWFAASQSPEISVLPGNDTLFLSGIAFYSVGVAASVAAHVLDGGQAPTNLDRLCGDLARVGKRRG